MKTKSSIRIFGLVLVTVFSLSALGSAMASAQTPAAATPAGDAKNGEKLFVTYSCYSCHGSKGRAGGAAPSIVPAPTAEALIKYVRKPSGGMPPYTSKSISDKELIDIQAYLAAIPKDVDPKTIQMLQNWDFSPTKK